MFQLYIILMSFRFYTYKKLRWHYFLIDFCYFTKQPHSSLCVVTMEIGLALPGDIRLLDGSPHVWGHLASQLPSAPLFGQDDVIVHPQLTSHCSVGFEMV